MALSWLLLSLVTGFRADSPQDSHHSVPHSCGRTAESLLPIGAPVPSRVRTPTPAEQRAVLGVSAPPLPDALDWRWLNGSTYTTRVGYQLLPSLCGSCWAFASAGALSDRGLLDCAAPDAGSCLGGSHTLAYEFIAKTGITDETCLPYKGMDYSNWGETDCADRMCRRCDRFGSCNFIPRNATPRVFVAEHGVVRGVSAMQAEIAARGPIACLMYAHAKEFDSYTGGVITDATRYSGITHVVVVTGWGIDPVTGIRYWVIRNSFGTSWGELGYYRQQIGLDIYNMESNDCAWATPNSSSIADLIRRAAM